MTPRTKQPLRSEKTTTTKQPQGERNTTANRPLRGHGSEKTNTTNKGKRGGGSRARGSQKTASTSITTTRKRRVGGGQGTTEKKATTTNTRINGKRVEECIHQCGDDFDDYDEQESGIVLERCKKLVKKLKQESKKEFQGLEILLIENGLSKNPSEAIRSLVQKSIHIPSLISDYIAQKITDAMKVLIELLIVQDWDADVARFILKYTKKVAEETGVEVKELQDIFYLAEAICHEPNKAREMMRGNHMRLLVKSWVLQTDNLKQTVKKWANSPTLEFMSIDDLFN